MGKAEGGGQEAITKCEGMLKGSAEDHDVTCSPCSPLSNKESRDFIVTQSCPTLCSPMDCSPPDSSCPCGFSRQEYSWVAMPSSRGSSQPRSSALRVDSLYHLRHQGNAGRGAKILHALRP